MNNVIRLLKESNHEAYLVGGYVRDLVLEKENQDIDIVTSASYEELKVILKDLHIVETGLKHGTVLVIDEGVHYELTSFRGSLNTLEDDLSKRDFTMNSLILDDEKIIDHVNGVSDIENKIIRANGDPYKRFKEDPLRILRAIRFSSSLDFDIEEKTKTAMFECKDLLSNVSSERIYSELVQLLLSHEPGQYFSEYCEILSLVIPELMIMNGFDQMNPHHDYDLLKHTTIVIDETPQDKVTRLSALFHDFGKIDTFTIDDKGIGHFYKHELYSVKRCKETLKRLKVDQKTIDEVCELVLYHDQELPERKRSVKRILSKLSYDQFIRLLDLKRADNKGHSEAYLMDESYYSNLIKIADQIIEDDEALSLSDLKIDGYDLIKLGYPKGKIIGDILKDLFEKVLNEEIENTKESLINNIDDKFERS